MGPYEHQIQWALDAVRIRAPGRVLWRGRRRSLVPHRARKVLGPEAASRLLHRELQWMLYSEFYCTGGREARQLCPDTSAAATQHFVEALARANRGKGCWDGGWALVQGGGERVIRRDGLELRLDGAEWRITEGPGGAVDLRLPKELRTALPGYYMALGDAALRPSGAERIVRAYWNVTAAGALELVRRATLVMNDEGLPFRLKVLTDLACFRRCDSAVLYLHAVDMDRAIPLIEKIYESIQGELLPGTPSLTRTIAHGLSLAETPPGGDSFGLHRCDVLAAGTIEASRRGLHGRDSRLAEVVGHLVRNGIDIDRPYAAAGNRSLDGIALTRRARSPRGSLSSHRRTASLPRASLDAARRIGAHLVARAIWSRDRCTWIGADAPADPRAPRGGAATFSPLGGDLYSGASGVAVFLAELAALTSDTDAERTALGAVRHALGRAAAARMPSGGLYTGLLSVAFAAARVGARLGEAVIVEEALAMAKGIEVDSLELDLVSGLAGAAAAFLALWSLVGDPALDARAMSAADALLRLADQSEDGMSWRSTASRGGPNLLGFAHGAAGIAGALLEAFAASTREDYKAAALGAFSYERAWFDARQRNWPTLRGARRTSTPRRSSWLPSMSYWCHGAPGVALSRIRAYEILGPGDHEDEARVALDTTARAIAEVEDARLESFSLCHGLAGNAWVLLEGSAVLPGPDPAWRETAQRVGRAGLETHRSPESWLCGTWTHGEPGLMLGIAGIGMFYLRLNEPSVSSILLPRSGARPTPRWSDP